MTFETEDLPSLVNDLGDVRAAEIVTPNDPVLTLN
mgnify:CR=1 FL=1